MTNEASSIHLIRWLFLGQQHFLVPHVQMSLYLHTPGRHMQLLMVLVHQHLRSFSNLSHLSRNNEQLFEITFGKTYLIHVFTGCSVWKFYVMIFDRYVDLYRYICSSIEVAQACKPDRVLKALKNKEMLINDISFSISFNCYFSIICHIWSMNFDTPSCKFTGLIILSCNAVFCCSLRSNKLI